MRRATRVIPRFAAMACAAVAGGAAADPPAEGREIQVISALVGGKNVFIPSTIVVAEGSENKLSIFNTTDMPHGFRIPELGIETVLAPGVETAVALPALEGGRVYGIDCQLHPPHRTATLAVLDRD